MQHALQMPIHRAAAVPFFDLKQINDAIGPQLGAAIQRVLASGHFIMGRELEAFEQEFAAFCGVKHCLGVGNGLDALVLLLQAGDIGPGDEVIVPSNTFIATWLAVTRCGATIVPVDPDPVTFNITADTIAPALTARTRAIIPVHLYGQTADMPAIMALAAQHDLFVIEDAAQAQGATCHGQRAGSLGHAAATSFYPTKNLGALGDGGAILTSDAKLAAKVALLRNYGSTVKYHHDIQGTNSRLDEMQAALLRVKLPLLEAANAQRQAVADAYTTELTDVGDLRLPHVPAGMRSVWHQYVVLTDRRDALQAFLKDEGVGTLVHYPIPPHRQQCYADHADRHLPVADAQAARLLSLPISPVQSAAQTARVIDTVRAFYA